MRIFGCAVSVWLASTVLASAGPIQGYAQATSPLNPTDQLVGTQPAGPAGKVVNFTPAQIAAFTQSNPPSASAAPLTGGEQIPGVQSGAPVYITPAQIAAYTTVIPYINPRNYGAVCDGVRRSPDDTTGLQAAADAAFGPSSNPHGTNYQLNVPLYIPGRCFTSSPILVTKVQGGKIFGDARFKAYIENTAGTGVFVTNGFQYSTVSGITFQDDGTTATVFDLNKTTSGGPSLQSDTFSDDYFQGGGIGVNIGAGNLQGSEMLFLNDFWAGASIAGLKTSNFNALQNTVVGGNFQSNAIGIWMFEGSVDTYSTGFQLSTTYDIKADNSGNDAFVVMGSRTESPNFLYAANGMAVTIVGAHQITNTSGIFASGGGSLTIIGSRSINGQVQNVAWGDVEGSQFGRSDWLGSINPYSSVRFRNSCYSCIQGSSSPMFVQDSVYNRVAGFNTTQKSYFPQKMYIPIPSGTTTSYMPFYANTRVTKVTVILDAAGSGGTCNVGDTTSATTYFSAFSLTGTTTVSATVDKLYAASDRVIVACTSSVGASGYVEVDMVQQLN